MATNGSGHRLGRRDGRILAVQLIYAHDVSPLTDFETHWHGIVEMMELGEEDLRFARDIAEGTVCNLFEINGLIGKFSRNWSISRVGKVTMAVLREAVYEILHRDDIPPPVTINEAIELVKLFGDENAAGFVNGVLDAVRNHFAGAEEPGRVLGPAEEGGGEEERDGANGKMENDLPAVEDAG